MIYRTYPLDARNEKITRALIVVHGAGRDADNYFRTAVAAAFLAAALDDTMVIAPRFASNSGGRGGCSDTLGPNEVNWSCNGDSWRSGGVSLSDSRLTSYDLTDEILRKLARKDIFPNLKAIVVSGHSAGGQFVTRYEMANKVHYTLGVPITYVVSNPSSYAYLDGNRPGANPNANRPAADESGHRGPLLEVLEEPFGHLRLRRQGPAVADAGELKALGDGPALQVFHPGRQHAARDRALHQQGSLPGLRRLPGGFRRVGPAP